jgi:hypothetical protein
MPDERSNVLASDFRYIQAVVSVLQEVQELFAGE